MAGATPFRLESPCDDSVVASPFVLEGLFQTHEGGILFIELIGENNILLMRQLQRVKPAKAVHPIVIYQQIFFEVAKDQQARLQVYTINPDRNVTRLVSVSLNLLKNGTSQLESCNAQSTWVEVDTVALDIGADATTLEITFNAKPLNTQPLVVELFSKTHGYFSSRLINVADVACCEESHTFTAEFTLKNMPQIDAIEFIIRQTDVILDGNVFLSRFALQDYLAMQTP